MKRIATLLGLGLIFTSPADGSDPLQVRAIIGAKPYLVGQAIEVGVEVNPTQTAPTIEPPVIRDAEIHPLPPDPSRPMVGRFVVVPGRAGTLILPPFRARSGDRTGTSKPVRLTIANTPTEGRTPAFLGGVGGFEIRAEAEPTGVRVGNSLEARVRITGQAAYGSVRPPNLGEWASSKLTIEAKGDRIEGGAVPVRTFLYRIRPLKSGAIRLPPLAIAAFDPATRRYATRMTSSLTIRVEEPPQFDPARLVEPPITPVSSGRRSPTIALEIGGVAIASGSIVAGWIAVRRKRAKRPLDPRRLAFELAEALSDREDEFEAARCVAEALTTFLHRVSGRHPGVLTPPEAHAGFERLIGDPGLSIHAERLVARCDRARYGGGTGGSADLIAEGRRFFEAVAESKVGEDRKPGETAEIASVI